MACANFNWILAPSPTTPPSAPHLHACSQLRTPRSTASDGAASDDDGEEDGAGADGRSGLEQLTLTLVTPCAEGPGPSRAQLRATADSNGEEEGGLARGASSVIAALTSRLMEGAGEGGAGGAVQADNEGGGGRDLADLLGSSDSPGGDEDAEAAAIAGGARRGVEHEEEFAGMGREELAAALLAAGEQLLQQEEDDEEDDEEGSSGDSGERERRSGGPQLPPLDLDKIVEELGSGASGMADSGADAGEPKRPASPPRRPREATFPRLLPPRPAAAALPAALSALRFIMLHHSLAAAVGGGSQRAWPAVAAEEGSGAGAGAGGGEASAGAYGDGPLWAAAAAVEVLGLRRAYRRLDLAGYLAHWQRYDCARREGREVEIAAEEAALRAEEDAAADEDGAAAAAVVAARKARAAAAADAAAAAALVAADVRAQRVWELAALTVGAPAAPPASGAPGGAGAVAFEAFGAAAPLEIGQDPDALARLPACAAPMLFSTAPSRFSSAARDAERRRAVALKRPAAAPAKAGLVDASRAARAVARFLEVAPPSAYSQSVREARSEVVSQIGSVRRGVGST
jgi:hypothetical protein